MLSTGCMKDRAKFSQDLKGCIKTVNVTLYSIYGNIKIRSQTHTKANVVNQLVTNRNPFKSGHRKNSWEEERLKRQSDVTTPEGIKPKNKKETIYTNFKFF